jgi:uncharacterized protein (DUF1810 family)
MNSSDINRFLLAQEGNHPIRRFQKATYAKAITELHKGHKSDHWIWYVFPQIKLGDSDISIHFSINSMAEAKEYLSHPILGARYEESCELLMQHASQHANTWDGIVAVLGADANKFRSSITLFGEAATICTNIGRPAISQLWTMLAPDVISPCSATLDFIVQSPPWCK